MNKRYQFLFKLVALGLCWFLAQTLRANDLCNTICKQYKTMSQCISRVESSPFHTPQQLRCCGVCFPGLPVLALGLPHDQRISQIAQEYSEILATIRIQSSKSSDQVSQGWESVQITLYPATQEEYEKIKSPRAHAINSFYAAHPDKNYQGKLVSMIVANKPLTMLATAALAKNITKIAVQVAPIHGLEQWQAQHTKAWWIDRGGICMLTVPAAQDGNWQPKLSC